MAQIAYLIERGQVKNPKKIKLEDKILKFSQKKPAEFSKTIISKSKNFWKALAGIDGKGFKKRALPKKVKMGKSKE